MHAHPCPSRPGGMEGHCAPPQYACCMLAQASAAALCKHSPRALLGGRAGNKREKLEHTNRPCRVDAYMQGTKMQMGCAPICVHRTPVMPCTRVGPPVCAHAHMRQAVLGHKRRQIACCILRQAYLVASAPTLLHTCMRPACWFSHEL